MSIAALLAAGALSAVGIPEKYSEALANRFPDWAAANNRNVYALLDVAIRPDGTMMACRVVEWKGSKKFADQSCALVWHIILEPARDGDGNAVHGRRKLPLKFLTTGRERDEIEETQPKPDYTVAVARMPEGDGDWAVNVLVGPDGKIGPCERAGAGAEVGAASLHEGVCNTLRTKRRFVLKDANDKPVSYVDMLLVRLSPTG